MAKVVVVHEPEEKPQPVVRTEAKPFPQKSQDKSTAPQSSSEPEAVIEPQAKPFPGAGPQRRMEPQPESAPVEALPGVAILVSDDIPAYTRVSKELAKRLKHRVKTYNLNGDVVGSSRVIYEVQRSDFEQVVAIGLLAAQTARRLRNKQVIFCQVFNYTDYDLITAWMKGVSMLPQLSEQFRIWKELSPLLMQVAVITGANQQRVVAEATEAAQQYGINLIHREVGTDKETLYTFNRLAPEIQGLWLLPDNRILSAGVIHALMAYSVRQGKQVLVFSPALLKLGGLISVRGKEPEIAAQVLRRLQQAYGQDEVPGPDVIPLTAMQLQINSRMVERLGLVLPARYRQLAYEP
jgi:ABC-type uncharacterized transport system substrate-binding protein